MWYVEEESHRWGTDAVREDPPLGRCGEEVGLVAVERFERHAKRPALGAISNPRNSFGEPGFLLGLGGEGPAPPHGPVAADRRGAEPGGELEEAVVVVERLPPHPSVRVGEVHVLGGEGEHDEPVVGENSSGFG
ncbi:MAG: hypothetical protein ABID40_00805 [Candidatus Bipolaricaulota bacterium]